MIDIYILTRNFVLHVKRYKKWSQAVWLEIFSKKKLWLLTKMIVFAAFFNKIVRKNISCLEKKILIENFFINLCSFVSFIVEVYVISFYFFPSPTRKSKSSLLLLIEYILKYADLSRCRKGFNIITWMNSVQMTHTWAIIKVSVVIVKKACSSQKDHRNNWGRCLKTSTSVRYLIQVGN